MAFEQTDTSKTPPDPSFENASGTTLKRGRKRTLLATLVKLAVSIGAIVLVLRTVDFRATFQRVEAQDLTLIMLAVAIMFAQLVFGGLRWHAVRRGLGIVASFANTLKLYCIGSFFSSYVISGLSGDVMRGWLSFKSGIDPARAVNSVVLDRVIVLAGIGIMMLAATPWFILKFGTSIEGWAPAGVSAGLFVAIFATSQVHRLPRSLLDNLPGRLALKLGQGMRDVFMNPAAAIRGIAAAVLAQVAFAGSAYAVALSLGIDISPLDCLIVMQIVAVAGAIPIAAGGWGVREAAVIGMFSLIGVGAEPALVLSVELGLIGLLVNLPGGLIWLLMPVESRSGTWTDASSPPAVSPN